MEENSYELFYTDETSLYKSVLVKNIDNGFLGRTGENHSSASTFNIDSYFSQISSVVETTDFHTILNSMIYHPSGIIFTCGPSNIMKGLSCDIILSCWSADLKYITSYGSPTKSSSLSLYYNGFLEESDIFGYKIRLSPDSNNLVCLNKCGELIIWKLILGNSNAEFKLEKIHSITSKAHISCNIPRSNFRYSDSSSALILNSQGQWPNHSISDISWWNNNTLILSLRSGRVVLSNLITLTSDSIFSDSEIISDFQGIVSTVNLNILIRHSYFK